jgi:crotonyl-CoA carboxylase/reductase
VINRKDFNCWGQLPRVNTPEYNDLVRRGAQVRQGDLGHHRQGRERRHGVRASGRGDLPGLDLRGKRGGMVVICAGTTGFNCTFDVRYMWMHQKRLAGQPFRASQAGSRREQADDRAPAGPLHVRGVPLGRDPEAT